MKLKIVLCSLCVLFLGIVGCNLFNPTEAINVDNSDADALTYEGYLKFRNNDYGEAERYFSKAIAADSSHSEAWYGSAKAKINLEEVNAFEILKYVNTDGNASVLPIAGMSDEMAQKYHQSINVVVDFMKKFITYDTTGRLDGVVTFKTISDSYMVLEMFQFMLVLRKEMPNIAACKEKDPISGLPKCSIGDILNGLHGNKGAESLEFLHEVALTCAKNPESMGSVVGQIFPGFSSLLSAEGKNTTTSASCEAIASVTEVSDDPDENEKNLSAVISFTGYSMDVDEDGDGCVDEEVVDGQDNDGDGVVDEDPRDNNQNFVFDEFSIAMNMADQKKGTSNLMIVKSVAPNEKYRSVDIDMDGQPADDDEWEFVHSLVSDRNNTGDHRFKFAANLVYNPQKLPFEEYMAKKKQVSLDYEGKYDLEYRKKYIGGCWVNYTEEAYRKNLEAQAARYKE